MDHARSEEAHACKQEAACMLARLSRRYSCSLHGGAQITVADSGALHNDRHTSPLVVSRCFAAAVTVAEVLVPGAAVRCFSLYGY